MRFGYNEDGVACRPDTQERARHGVAIETRRTDGPISSAATGTRGMLPEAKVRKSRKACLVKFLYVYVYISYV